jgi:hypothetical protein
VIFLDGEGEFSVVELEALARQFREPAASARAAEFVELHFGEGAEQSDV